MMAQLRNVAILVVVLVAAVLLQTAEAEDYEVGGAPGWTSFPPGGASFYSKWAANFTFKLNNTLVFNFDSGSHSVVELTKANYENCEVDNNLKAFNRGPARITLDRTGEFYFSCTFSGHCSSGQKLSIKVTGSSTPSPTPTPQKAPAKGHSTSPPTPTPQKGPAEGPSASPPASDSVPSSGSNEGAPSSQTEPAAIAPPPQGSATPLGATISLFLITIAINFLSQS